MTLYHVSVKKNSRNMYFPEFLHDNIGYCWQKDEEHVWFKFVHRDASDGNTYLSSPNRFCWADVEISLIPDADSEEISKEDLLRTIE